MRKVILLCVLAIGMMADAQNVQTIAKPLKLNIVAAGTAADSVLVRGADKIVKFVPRSSFGGGETSVSSGQYTPTLLWLGGNGLISEYGATSAIYTVVGNVVTVTANFEIIINTNNQNHAIYVSLPPGLLKDSQAIPNDNVRLGTLSYHFGTGSSSTLYGYTTVSQSDKAMVFIYAQSAGVYILVTTFSYIKLPN